MMRKRNSSKPANFHGNIEEGGGQGVSSDMPPLPEGWTEVVAQDDGSVYYYNATKNITQWTHPALGEDEEMIIDLLDPSMIFR